nr:response regulator [Calditrichia bacterium]
MRILIAEDEAVSRRLLERRLTEWGHEVVAAVNGREALAFFREAPFSLVITDWVMPEMDGLELVRRIRREAEEYVYIIMLTSKAEKSDLVKGMDNGADDFIHKPFDKEELRVRLRAGERIVELEARLKQKNEALSQASDKMFESIRAAAVIQNSLLPAQVPDLPNVRVAWRFQPCDELAGDILNVLQLDEENLGFYVLDVSGHGVPAALLAVTLSRILSPLEDQASLLIEKDEKTGRQRIVNP